MQIYKISLILLLFTLPYGCDEPGPYSSVPEDVKLELQERAAAVARYMVIHPATPSRPRPLSQEQINEIAQLCDPHPEAWSYFYSCVAETISTLEPPLPSCQTDDSTSNPDPDTVSFSSG